jgi:signal transduction histidine kinase
MNSLPSGSSAHRPAPAGPDAAAVIARLTEQAARFEAILDAHPERISVVDPSTHEVLFANRRCREDLRRDPVGQVCWQALHGLEDRCGFCRGSILAEQPGIPVHWEHHDDRLGRDYAITDILIPWTDGRLVHYQLAADCTERRRLERAAESHVKELARSNAELEQFAYLASHDLQEPLRKIQTFGDRLAAHLGDGLDGDGREIIGRMFESAQRMQRMVNDLLMYSRVGLQAQLLGDVDPAVIARQVVSDLEVRIEQSGGRVEIGALPLVEADPTQLRLLLQNLVGNALKFHRPGVPPVVTIAGSERGRHVLLTVTDNGIGFDEKHKDRIFRLFQRLHTRQEYEGTGLGLAVCERIAQRHGGSIVAAGRPGEGATFTVILPRRQQVEA